MKKLLVLLCSGLFLVAGCSYVPHLHHASYTRSTGKLLRHKDVQVVTFTGLSDKSALESCNKTLAEAKKTAPGSVLGVRTTFSACTLTK